jgi:hypothetical protein
MDTTTPKANPPGYWPGQLAQVAREAAARMTRLADEMDALAERERQDALAREAVPDGTYGGAR